MNSIKTLATWFVNGCFINWNQFNGVCSFEVRYPSGISLDFNSRAAAFRAANKGY